MLSELFLALALSSALPAATASAAGDIGTAYCFGVNCGCGNGDPSAGCANSTGSGGALTATGSTSVSADDAVFHSSRLPPNKLGLFVFSRNQRNIPFGDGRMCVGPNMHRVGKHYNSGTSRSIAGANVLGRLSESSVYVQAGETWYVQMWYRDPVPFFACTNGATTNFTNLTNALSITFTP